VPADSAIAFERFHGRYSRPYRTLRSTHLILLLLALATLAAIIPWRGVTPRNPQTLRMVVWGMPSEDYLFRDGYARGFEALQPGVHVQYERYVEVADKYFTWHLNGEGADVMRVRITDYHSLVANGVLAPLDGLINSADPDLALSAADQADFIPAIWNALQIKGQRYAIPSDNAQYGLYYNKAIFSRYNAAHPDHPLVLPSADWTWDDLRRAARALTVRDERGRIVQYGVDFALWSWPFMAFYAQAGGELWDADRTTTLIDCDAGKRALALISELLPQASSARSPEMAETGTGPDKLFATGQTAMLLDGSWRALALELANPDLDFAVAPLPHDIRSAVASGSVLWAISAHSQSKELAWRMIKWMTSREQSLRYWDALRVAPPARVSVIHSDAFQATRGLADASGKALTPGMPGERFDDRARWLLYAVTPYPRTGELPGFVPVAPYQNDLENKVSAMLTRATAPGRTASFRELLDEAATETHRIIDRDRAARGLVRIVRPGS